MSHKIIFHSGVGTVTGANFSLETNDGSHILIDCGMVQGSSMALEENRQDFPYDITSICALIITHAHFDHVGRIPKLVKAGYTGPIYSTTVTRDLAEVVLRDSVNILRMEADRNGLEPLYVLDDVIKSFNNWKTYDYHHEFTVTPDTKCLFKDAGHILGSAMIEIAIHNDKKDTNDYSSSQSDVQNSTNINTKSEIKILFTGDLGNSPAPLLRDTESAGDIDCIVIESVYGDRNHESRVDRSNKLEKIIKQTIGRGGTLLIPAFAIDRTQVLLYELNNLVEQKKIPSIPVFVDSPMATLATQIYASHTDLFNDTVKSQIKKGDDVLKFPHLSFTISNIQSNNIDNIKGPKIILAGSGMSLGGRILGHEAEYLSNPNNTLLLVGYQTTGSLGRRIADGGKRVQIDGNMINIKAHIETMYGYSAHRDSDHLVEFVATSTERLKKVYVVMGEPKGSMHLAQRLNDELGVKAMMPEKGVEYDIV